jgi:hypothetical protein
VMEFFSTASALRVKLRVHEDWQQACTGSNSYGSNSDTTQSDARPHNF